MSKFFAAVHWIERKWAEAKLHPKGTILALLILFLFIVLFTVLCLKTLLALGCIVIFLAVVLPAYLPQWRSGTSFLLVLCGLILVLQEQKWFQGFFQNTTVSLLQKQGREYGEKLKDFQDEMEIRDSENLSNSLAIKTVLHTVTQQQARIDAQQLALDGAEVRVTGLLFRAESLLGQAEERQRNIETNLYAMTTNLSNRVDEVPDTWVKWLTDWQYESFTFDDTNHLLAIEKDDGAIILLIRVSRPAIFNTVVVDISNAKPSRSLSLIRDNIVANQMTRELFDSSVVKDGILVKYLPNPFSTNIYSWSILSTNLFAINGLTMTPLKGLVLPSSK